LHIFEQHIASSWIGKHIIDCSNITKSNIEAHKWNGIALCVLTLIHVWSILVPCVTHNWKAQVVPGYFEWPLSERTPPGFKDANPDTETMSLQGDDVFRMVEMTILLGILTPLSVRWMQRCWHLGIQVHRFVSVIYFVDIVRRHSHPHSWVLNTPIFVVWILDKILSHMYRKVKVPGFYRETISTDYIALYWNVENNDEAHNEIISVGSNYYMKMYPASFVESRHPFTTFKNRLDNCDFLLANAESENGQEARNTCFTNGAIIRTFRNKRKPRIGAKSEIRSHTERMTESPSSALSSLFVWGPFQGNVTNVIPKSVLEASLTGKKTVLAGSGSAVNFMIDLFSHLCNSLLPDNENLCTLNIPNNQVCVTFLYSTRDVALHEWVTRAMVHFLGSIDASSDVAANLINFRVVLACTSYNSEDDLLQATTHLNASFMTMVGEDGLSDVKFTQLSKAKDVETNTISSLSFPSGSVDLTLGRLNYEEEIPSGSNVFCQGSEYFKKSVAIGCRSKKDIQLFFDQ